MYSNDVKNLGDNLSNLKLSNSSPRHGSPPEIPPKPKRSADLNRDPRIGQYVMKPKTHLPVDSYYAVNAPAPGIIGVASARLNRGYSEGQDIKLSQPSMTSPLYHNSSVLQSSLHAEYANETPIYQNEDQMPMHDRYHDSSLHSRVLKDQPLYSNVKQPHAPHYSSYGADGEFPPPPDDIMGHMRSPPSPVSSSYSELRHAHVAPIMQAQSGVGQEQIIHHGGSNKYTTYAPQSLTSSTYESIYEPISPRPDSQMSHVSSSYDSARVHHGPYSSPYSKGAVPSPSAQPILNPDKVGKEAEVDALTNLLVQSMDSSSDPEFFGICARCGERVVGEGSGCTAMEQVFHIQCFCCVVCLLKLQGKPFYALESKPYCEDCYLNTLEKCCVCTKPILDRILRATGKPYHPGCFTCVVCHKSLDGIPFTVDASNQIHCIDDFHKKFAPRCSVCREPIMPEAGQDETVRVVALDRSFHVNCYKCEDCGLVLSSEAEGRGCYPLDGHVLCKSCNARRVQALTSKVTTEL